MSFSCHSSNLITLILFVFASFNRECIKRHLDWTSHWSVQKSSQRLLLKLEKSETWKWYKQNLVYLPTRSSLCSTLFWWKRPTWVIKSSECKSTESWSSVCNSGKGSPRWRWPCIKEEETLRSFFKKPLAAVFQIFEELSTYLLSPDIDLDTNPLGVGGNVEKCMKPTTQGSVIWLGNTYWSLQQLPFWNDFEYRGKHCDILHCMPQARMCR